MHSRISPQLDKRLVGTGSGLRPYRWQSHQRPLTALSSLLKFYFVAGVFTALLIPFLITLCVFGYFWAFDRIAPQVRVGNTSLQGLSVYDAAVRVQKNYNLDRQLILSDGARSWKVTPSTLGLTIDPLATAQNAFQIGHGHDVVTDILQIMASQKNGSIVQPVVQFDAKAANFGLEALAKQVEIPPVNASLRLDGDQLIATPGVRGYSLDIERTLDALRRNSAGIVASGSLSLPLKAVAPRIADVSASQSKIQHLLDSSFRIIGYDPVSNESLDWSVSREDRLKWLKLNQDGQDVEIDVDAAQVQAYLDSLNHSLAPDRRIELSEYLEPAIQSIQDGQKLTILIRHNPT
ncbi:MAG: peptidoglycan binding domain-containing protein, partial [Omnitrophica WOR_2 bacterium]